MAQFSSEDASLGASATELKLWTMIDTQGLRALYVDVVLIRLNGVCIILVCVVA